MGSSSMSKYRDRREKIQQQQSKSLDNLQLYRKGAHVPHHQSSVVWDEIKKQKERGGYPWTHLSHDQDAEVWIDPVKLPRDITTATLKRKDQSIPREWFHLPKGAQPPTVEDLLRDSSPDDVETTAKIANADNRRAKSPPICGRGRSRSKERKPHKHHGQQQNTSHKQFVDDGGYEPVGKERSEQAAASSSSSNRREAIQPLNKMSQMAAASVETKTSFIGSKFSKNSNNKQILPPRKAFTALPEPPEVNRDTKPTVFDHTAGALINDQLQQQMPKQTNGDEAGGYEPVGLERRRKDYEDMDKSIPPEYAKVDKSKKVEVKSHEINNGLPDEKGKHDKAEKEEEQEKKLKEKLEKEQKEKLEKEIKLKEKMEKEQKVAEEKERKLKERLEKEEKKAKEKFEKEQREAEEKERKLKERLEKEQKDKLEKEKKLKEKLEKEQKDKEEKERKLKEKLEKEQKEKLEKEQKQNEEKEKKLKEKQEKEQREKLEKEKKQKDKEEKE